MPTQETRKITGQTESALDGFYKVALTKKALIEAIGAGAQQITNFAETTSAFNRPLDECVFIKPEINSDNPYDQIPIVFVYSNPEIARARQVKVQKTLYNDILQIQHEKQNISIKISTWGCFDVNQIKYVKSLRFFKRDYSSDELSIQVTNEKTEATKKTISALGILVEQSGDELKYHPFIIELPVNYLDVVRNNGQIMSNQELREMKSKIEAAQTASDSQVVAQEPNSGGDGTSRRSKILIPAPTKAEASSHSRPNKLSVPELRNQITVLQTQINTLRRDNTGSGIKDKIKVINKEIERIKSQIEHKTHPENNRGYNSF